MKSLGLIFPPLPGQSQVQSCEVNKGKVTTRELTWVYGRFGLEGFSAGQSAAQLETTVFDKKTKLETTKTTYFISNFRFGEVSAAEILKFKRNHWGIENHLHRTRDVEMGEDAHRLRVPGLAQILAALSNAVICLLHNNGYKSVRQAAELFVAEPYLAFQLFSG
jgi:predicted transposase YbfD/YdcC